MANPHMKFFVINLPIILIYARLVTCATHNYTSDKFNSRSNPYIFVGYQSGWKVFDLHAQKIFTLVMLYSMSPIFLVTFPIFLPLILMTTIILSMIILRFFFFFFLTEIAIF